MKRAIILSVLSMLCWTGVWAQANLETGIRYYKWEDYARALPYLQAAAKEGYGEACYLLGGMYYSGKGVAADSAIALRMYERGLEYGYNRGEIELGDIYFYTKKDRKKAYELYCLGYKNKRSEAASRIAMYYYYSDLVAAIDGSFNLDKAFELIGSSFDEAARSSDRNVLKLASMYCLSMKDSGAKIDRYKDPGDAACELLYKGNWHYDAVCLMRKLNKAVVKCWYMPYNKFYVYRVVTEADQYSYPALQKGEMFYIYAMFAHEYNDIDYRMNWGYTAAEAMEKAANYGYAPAQKIIGDWYANGTHIAKNILKAREWYAKAKANGEAVPEL